MTRPRSGLFGDHIPAGAGESFFLYSVQTVSVTYPESYSMGKGGTFTEIKRPVLEADHSSPATAEGWVRMTGAVTPFPLYAFIAFVRN